jgi:hypothetical protein
VSVRFDAATDQVSRANPPSVAAGFTLLGWVRVRVDTNTWATFARISVSGTTIVTWFTSEDGTSGPNYFSGGGTLTNSTGTPVDAWRKVAIACTGTSGKVYIQNPGNATELDSGTVSSAGTPTLLAVGGRGSAGDGEFLNGNLARLRLYSAELSQAEIEAEWDSAVAVRTAGLWADWPLATDLNDVSGNGRHLSAGSTAVTWEDDPPTTVASAFAGTLPGPVSGALTGTVTIPGALAGTLPGPVGSLAGAAFFAATLAGTLPMPRGTLTGTMIDPSALTLPLRAGVPAVIGQLRAGEAEVAGQLHAGSAGIVEQLRAGAPT